MQLLGLNLNNAIFGFYNGNASAQYSAQREYYGRSVIMSVKYAFGAFPWNPMMMRHTFAVLRSLLTSTGGRSGARRRRDRPLAAATHASALRSSSAGINRFSFITYGDTRGRHDGTEIQAEHAAGRRIDDRHDQTIREHAGCDQVRRAERRRRAEREHAAQLSVSYVPLINRLTQEGGVPYFLSVGNHDVGNGRDTMDARRAAGLRNYFAANARLIPREGSPHRLNGLSDLRLWLRELVLHRLRLRHP